MQWTSHCVLWHIDFVGVLFGLWPRFCCFWCFAVCFAVSSGEAQVWLGDLQVVVFGWFWWFLCVVFIDLPAQMDMICPCTNAFLAYAHVRTEPLARHRPHSRKKKRVPRHQLSCEDDSDFFFPEPRYLSAGQRGIEPPPAACQRHKSSYCDGRDTS